MPRNITKYGIFIASPGDVAKEREDIVSVIDKWNKLNSVKSGVELEPLRWENNILPDIEARGQDSINKNLLARADLLIAVFWTRIGAGGTAEELATFKGQKLAYFCKKAMPMNFDVTQVEAVKQLSKKWQANGAFIEDFQDREKFKDTLLQHLDQWIIRKLRECPPEFLPGTPELTQKAFCKAEDLRSMLWNWANTGKPGIILLFNIELATFRSEEEFRSTWAPICTSDGILRIILVLPSHKRRRLIRYVREYSDDFGNFVGKEKFEVADFPDNNTSPIPALGFAAFRLGKRANRGKCHKTSLLFLLTEPFSTREQAYGLDGPLWRYDVMFVCSEGDAVTGSLLGLLSQFLPDDETTKLSELLIVRGRPEAPPRPENLPGNREQPAALERRLKIREDLFFANVPTYVLDKNYYLIDWNASFDLVFGGCGFHRGEYVLEFLNCLANAKEVISRGKDFVSDPPLFDDEEFVFNSPSFGKMRFLKTTAQALDHENGNYHGWNVALSLTSVEKADVYRKDLRSVVEYETLMGSYAPVYNRIMDVFSDYRSLALAMGEAVGEAGTVLDLGAGPGHLSKILARRGKYVVAIDANDAMLACANDNCASEIEERQIEIHKANLEFISPRELSEMRSENFRPPYDAVVMLNVFYAIRDKPRLLTFLRAVVKPGGFLALSGPGNNVDLNILFGSVESDLQDAHSNDLRVFKDVNRRMLKLGLLKQSVSETSQLLTTAGFEVLRTDETVFSGQGVLIVAKAP